jgi:hypothetical protein
MLHWVRTTELTNYMRFCWTAKLACAFQVVVAASGFLGSIFLIAFVRGLGKRMLGLSTTAACAISCLLLGLYASLAIRPVSDAGETSNPALRWLPLVLFALLSFASTAQGQLPWLLVAECFPFRYVPHSIEWTTFTHLRVSYHWSCVIGCWRSRYIIKDSVECRIFLL